MSPNQIVPPPMKRLTRLKLKLKALFQRVNRVFIGLLKLSAALLLFVLSRSFRLIKYTPTLINNSLKTIALFFVCLYLAVHVGITVGELIPQGGVSSHQVVPNLPKMIPSTVLDYKRSAVKLYINGQFTCSGVVISQNYLLTASHCLVNEDMVMTRSVITIVNEVGDVRTVGKAVGVDTRMDWGLIKGSFEAIPGAEVIYDHFELEQQVLACGYPHGTKAIVCNVLAPQINDGFVVKCIGGVFPGMSGGPVFTHDGRVLGINVLAYPIYPYGGGVAFTPTVGILASFGIEP